MDWLIAIRTVFGYHINLEIIFESRFPEKLIDTAFLFVENVEFKFSYQMEKVILVEDMDRSTTFN